MVSPGPDPLPGPDPAPAPKGEACNPAGAAAGTANAEKADARGAAGAAVAGRPPLPFPVLPAAAAPFSCGLCCCCCCCCCSLLLRAGVAPCAEAAAPLPSPCSSHPALLPLLRVCMCCTGRAPAPPCACSGGHALPPSEVVDAGELAVLRLATPPCSCAWLSIWLCCCNSDLGRLPGSSGADLNGDRSANGSLDSAKLLEAPEGPLFPASPL